MTKKLDAFTQGYIEAMLVLTSPVTLAADRLVAVANAAKWPSSETEHAKLFDALRAASVKIAEGNIDPSSASTLLRAVEAAPWPSPYNVLLVLAIGSLRKALLAHTPAIS
jgi:hypothetical protein